MKDTHPRQVAYQVIKSIQDNPDLTNAFNGKRVKRGLFLDTVINKVFNANVNGAVNHIKAATFYLVFFFYL
jgi:hypothetical protein